MLTRIKKIFPQPARMAEIPADWIDKVYLEEPKTVIGVFSQFMRLRSLYAIFSVTSAVDLVTAGVLSMRYSMGALFSADDVQDAQLSEQKKYNSLFSKNFLAMMGVIPGMVSPRFVTLHFLSEKNSPGVRAGGNRYYAPDAKLLTPESIDEIKIILNDAKMTGIKVMPMGAGRSQGKQFLPEGENGTVIDLRNFNKIVINEEAKTAIVGAGVIWSDLQIEANKFKLALQVMQASNIFSVGGSIGTNVHGWKHTMGMLSNTILSMNVINPQGELQKLTPEDELFHYITGGLGLMGIVVSVEIQLIDNVLLQEVSTKVSNEEYVTHFYQNVLTNPNIHMHLFRLSLDPNKLLQSGVSVDYVLTDDLIPKKTPHLTAERMYGNRKENILINAARYNGPIRKFYWNTEEKHLLKNNSQPMTTNAIMQPPINAMFTPSKHQTEWLQEYFLPNQQLSNFLTALGQLLVENHVRLLNASVRYVKQNAKSPLSYAHDGDRFAVVLCFSQFLLQHELIKAEKWLRLSQHLAVSMGGSYYLPYQHISSLDSFQRSYPYAEQFIRMKEKIDPAEIFVSGFYQKYLAEHKEPQSHIRAIMANEETKKEFSGFLHHVLMRVDSEKLYRLIEDVFTYKDSDAEIYEELALRVHEIMPSVIHSGQRIFRSLSAIKNDLGTQAKILLPDVKEIDGLVEIGYPGRFVEGFQKQFHVTGKITVVLEGTSVTDYIQTNFRKPYHVYHQLDYANPNLKELPEDSADVITCYVGLHHFPEHTVKNFLHDVRRVLRPEGHFLLVDHDVVDKKSLHYAQGAHTIFNVMGGVSKKEEMGEIRNFQPMSYWQNLLEEVGFQSTRQSHDQVLIRQGDPSRNRMMCFVNGGRRLSLSNGMGL